MEYYSSALKIYKELEAESAIHQAYSNIGLIYFYQKCNYDLALKYFITTLEIREKLASKLTDRTTYSFIDGGNLEIKIFSEVDTLCSLVLYLDYLKAPRFHERPCQEATDDENVGFEPPY